MMVVESLVDRSRTAHSEAEHLYLNSVGTELAPAFEKLMEAVDLLILALETRDRGE